jgi:hypothetical protein
MPAGHTDLFDGIYGKRGEGLRGLGQFEMRQKVDLSGQRQEETVSEVRAKSTVGNSTPALLTSSS